MAWVPVLLPVMAWVLMIAKKTWMVILSESVMLMLIVRVAERRRGVRWAEDRWRRDAPAPHLRGVLA
jgi:hypothetical protein